MRKGSEGCTGLIKHVFPCRLRFRDEGALIAIWKMMEGWYKCTNKSSKYYRWNNDHWMGRQFLSNGSEQPTQKDTSSRIKNELVISSQGQGFQWSYSLIRLIQQIYLFSYFLRIIGDYRMDDDCSMDGRFAQSLPPHQDTTDSIYLSFYCNLELSLTAILSYISSHTRNRHAGQITIFIILEITLKVPSVSFFLLPREESSPFNPCRIQTTPPVIRQKSIIPCQIKMKHLAPISSTSPSPPKTPLSFPLSHPPTLPYPTLPFPYFMKNKYNKQSVPHDTPEHLSPLLQMLLLRHHRDTLGSQNGTRAHLPQVVLGTASEDLTQLPQSQVLEGGQSLPHLRKILPELLLGEELEENGDVDILPAPLGIDEADSRVESGQDGLDLSLGLPQEQGATFDHPLRLLPTTEEGVELVDDIRFAILLGAQNLLLDCLLHPSLGLPRDDSGRKGGGRGLRGRNFSGELSCRIASSVEVGLGV